MSGFFNILNQFTNFVSYIIYVVSSVINNLGTYIDYVYVVVSYMPETIYMYIASFVVINLLWMFFFHKWGIKICH